MKEHDEPFAFPIPQPEFCALAALTDPPVTHPDANEVDDELDDE
jgi:hypothetical protein